MTITAYKGKPNVVAEVLELAGNAARDNKTRIIPRRGSPRLSLDSRKACLNPEASPGVLAVVPVVVVFLWLELLGGPSSSPPTIHMKFWSNELALYTAVMWEVRLQLAHSVHLNEPITDIFAFGVRRAAYNKQNCTRDSVRDDDMEEAKLENLEVPDGPSSPTEAYPLLTQLLG